MPKVETYDSPQVAAQALRTPLQRLDSRGAFGEALGQGIVDNAQSIFKIEQDRQERDDAAVAKERVNSYREFSRKRMFLDEDAYMTRQGRSAYDSHADMQRELEEHERELGKDLPPPATRISSAIAWARAAL